MAEALAAEPLPQGASRPERQRREVPAVGAVGAGILRVGVHEAVAQRELGHDRRRALLARPHRVAAAAVGVDVHAREARRRRPAVLRGGRPRVAVVVLDHHRGVRSDQGLVGVAGPLGEHGLRAHQAAAADGAGALEHDDVHRIGVVGDRDVVAAHQGRRRARALLRLAGLGNPDVGVRGSPRDRRCPVSGRVEPVEGAVGDDVHAAGLVDRERVADRLVRGMRLHRTRAGVDRAHEALGRREPQPARPVG